MNAPILAEAVAYANKLLNRNVSIEWGEKAVTADFLQGMAQSWVWGAVVRAHYDAKTLPALWPSPTSLTPENDHGEEDKTE